MDGKKKKEKKKNTYFIIERDCFKQYKFKGGGLLPCAIMLIIKYTCPQNSF